MNSSARQGLPASAEALVSGVVDYAGLFPPAALSMREALAAFAKASTTADALLLGRFVVPAGRITEMREHLGIVSLPIHLSVIVNDRSDADIAALAQCDGTSVIVDALECKSKDLDGIDWLADKTAGLGADVYVEIDPAADLPAWFARLAAHRLRAKIRTGGTVATAFPPPAAIVDFMTAALNAGVPFKATAGLHHAVRGRYRLTYEQDSANAVMHGYLNVLLAAAALRSGQPRAIAEQVLQLDDRAALVFGDRSVRWGSLEWANDILRSTRADLVGFGSCSITEPADDIRALTSSTQS